MNLPSQTFTNLTSIEAVMLATGRCDQLGRDRFREIYGFGESRKYVLRHAGREYDSKAVAAVAYGIQHPGEPALTPETCSGGRASGQAGWALHRLGFDVDGLTRKQGDWSQQEVLRTVETYFEMLELELAGASVPKKPFIEKLQQELGRSKKAVEYKFANVSAVLHNLDMPYVQGYKPLEHYQALLAFAVEDRLRSHGENLLHLPKGHDDEVDAGACFVPAPITNSGKKSAPRAVGGATKIDWGGREGRNRQLGTLGEDFVMRIEADRLSKLGLSKCAKAIEWVSKVQGDGLGYDIASFDDKGKPIFIEVKTTIGGRTQPFFVTRNEVEVSREKGTAYRLYRVFDFARSPKIYELAGPLDKVCDLDPVAFQVRPASA